MGQKITDPKHYSTRRTFMRAAVLGGTTLATGLIYRRLTGRSGGRHPDLASAPRLANFSPTTSPATGSMAAPSMAQAFHVNEPQTSYQDITHYNNYYEFSTDKEGVADAAAAFVSRPWKIAVGGLAPNRRHSIWIPCSRSALLKSGSIVSVASKDGRW
jgi:sulfoxide reductase catalytic subunit YedY